MNATTKIVLPHTFRKVTTFPEGASRKLIGREETKHLRREGLQYAIFMLLQSNVVKQLSSIMIHISHSCWRHVMMRPLMSDRLLCMALVFVQSLVDLCSSLWCLSMMNPVHNNCLLTLEMFFKCYCSIASEFLFYRFHKLQWKVPLMLRLT